MMWALARIYSRKREALIFGGPSLTGQALILTGAYLTAAAVIQNRFHLQLGVPSWEIP